VTPTTPHPPPPPPPRTHTSHSHSLSHAANLPQQALQQLPADFATGIYFGWASVDGAGCLCVYMYVYVYVYVCVYVYVRVWSILDAVTWLYVCVCVCVCVCVRVFVCVVHFGLESVEQKRFTPHGSPLCRILLSENSRIDSRRRVYIKCVKKEVVMGHVKQKEQSFLTHLKRVIWKEHSFLGVFSTFQFFFSQMNALTALFWKVSSKDETRNGHRSAKRNLNRNSETIVLNLFSFENVKRDPQR